MKQLPVAVAASASAVCCAEEQIKAGPDHLCYSWAPRQLGDVVARQSTKLAAVEHC